MARRSRFATLATAETGGLMPPKYNPDGSRDYTADKDYHSKPKQVKARSERNKARRKLGLKVGDKREVDHGKPLSKGGTNHKNTLKAVSRTTNRKKYNK